LPGTISRHNPQRNGAKQLLSLNHPRFRASIPRHMPVGYAFVLPVAAYMIFFLAFPVLLNIVISTLDVNASNLLTFSAPFKGIRNYTAVVHDPSFRPILQRTLVFTVVSVVGQVTIATGLAMVYDRTRGGQTIAALWLATAAVPLVAFAQVVQLMLDPNFGLINWILRHTGIVHSPVGWLSDPSIAIWTLTAVNIWLGLPFAIVYMLAALRGIPNELRDAADVDGAGPLRTILYIVLPLLRPALLIIMTLSVIGSLKLFDLVYVTTGGGPAGTTDVLVTQTYRLVFQYLEVGLGAAWVNVLSAIVLVFAVLYLFLSRREEPLA
jgi:multiple sugar transport system permease protein